MTFTRQGDFYNATGDDATRVASELGLTLQKENNQPSCGIPAHRLEPSIRELTDKGFMVIIASPKDWKR